MLNKLNEAFQAARQGDDPLRKSILSLLIGEIQLVQNKATKDHPDISMALTERQIVKITKKLKKSCDDVAAFGCPSAKREAAILAEYLPKPLSLEEIQCIIVASPLYQEILDMISCGNSPMRLTSRATDLINETGKDFNGKDVSTVMKELANA